MEDSSAQSFIPVFSQEMTLQAHFTFTSPSSLHLKRHDADASATTTTQSLNVGPNVSTGKSEAFQWSGERAKCSVSCDPHSVTLKYDATAPTDSKELGTIPKQHTPLKLSLSAPEESDKLSFHPSRVSAIFSPEHEPKENKYHTARPYERRCKSTAQIILQPQTKATQTKTTAREFHGVTSHEAATTGTKKEKAIPNVSTHPVDDDNLRLCYGCKQPPLAFPNCFCSHCAAFHNLVKSLRYELPCPCSCPHQPLQHFHAPRGFNLGSSAGTFNSHRCYDAAAKHSLREGSSPSTRRRKEQREGTPIPSSRTPSPDERHKVRHRTRRDGTSSRLYTYQEETGAPKRIHSKSKGRPKTIHIDVYCTSSSSSDQDSSDASSPTTEDSSLNSHSRSAHALVALGSKKNHHKNDFKLEKPTEKSHLLEKRASSFVYQHRADKEQTISAFITDHPLSLCSSPPHPERPVSSPPHVGFKRYKKEASANNSGMAPYLDSLYPLPMPVKPNSLPIASHHSQDFHSSISDIASYTEKYQHSQDHEMGTSLSWRGSEFETSTPHLSSDWEIATRSESNLSSLQAAFADMNTESEEGVFKGTSVTKHWRSPKLERRKYLTREQEERHQELVNKRDSANFQLSGSEMVKTPTEVSELAKLSVFKDFSKEELEVISRSLTKRESECSLRNTSKSIYRQSSFHSPQKPSLTRHTSLSAAATGTDKSSFAMLHSSMSKSVPITKVKKDVHTHFAEEPCQVVIKNEGNQSLSWEDEDGTSERELCENKDIENISTFRIPSEQLQTCDVKQSVGTGSINVGVFRRFNRFPFNATHTYPGSLLYQGARKTEPQTSDYKFVRPHLFGEVIKANKRHGIHFGPPRNPQCSCRSCRIWQIGHTSADALSEQRLRSHSLSDLSPVHSTVPSRCDSNQHPMK